MLGANLAITLREAGLDVRATRRDTSAVAHLDGHGIEWVPASLSDVGALTDAFRGADLVFHCAAQVSIVQRVTPSLVSGNVVGTKNVIEAVRAAKVGRLVHCSTVNAVGMSVDGNPVDERAPWNFDALGLTGGYGTTKRQAEELVRGAVSEGLDAVIVNPSYMLGPYDAKPSSGKLIVDVARRKVPGLAPGMNNFVDVRDVARGMLLAANKGRVGERYILGGENLSYAAVIDRIAKCVGVQAPTWNIPRPVATMLGWVGDLQERFGSEALLNSSSIRFAFSKAFIFSSAKAESELGYAHGSLETAIVDAVRWFRGAGMIPKG